MYLYDFILTVKEFLIFLVLPRIVPFHFDTPIFAGQAAQITCLVSEGDPPFELHWTFQNQNIWNFPGVSTMKAGSKASMLLIESANERHSGNYTCSVHSRGGIANYTTSLKIHGNFFFLFSFLQFFLVLSLSISTPQSSRVKRHKSHV